MWMYWACFECGLSVIWACFEYGLSVIWAWFGRVLSMDWACFGVFWVWFERDFSVFWVWIERDLSVIWTCFQTVVVLTWAFLWYQSWGNPGPRAGRPPPRSLRSREWVRLVCDTPNTQTHAHVGNGHIESCTQSHNATIEAKVQLMDYSFKPMTTKGTSFSK